jgi:hypothetical protein
MGLGFLFPVEYSCSPVGVGNKSGLNRTRQDVPNRTFLELPFLEEIGQAICLPQWDAVTSGEGEVVFAIGVGDKGIGSCLGRDVQACVVVVGLLHFD